MADVRIGDAYARGGATGFSWTVGSKAVELTYEFQDGVLRLTSFRNKSTNRAREYISKTTAISPFTVHAGRGAWAVENASARSIAFGGRPAAELELVLERGGVRATLHAVAFPGTSVVRQWVELKNTGGEPVKASATPFAVALRGDDAGAFTHCWMTGGTSGPDHGMMHSAPIAASYHGVVAGNATRAFMPWTALERSGTAGDGWFLELEYLANWKLEVAREASGPAVVTADVPDLDAVDLAPGQSVDLPAVTLCAYAGGRDGMAKRSYDWQYEYMWDYTNMDFYARPKWAVSWFYCARNIQEQFAERLAYLDMDADQARAMGFDMIWDDAGWALYRGWPDDNYANVFTENYEGPDFGQTIRYLAKSGMNWLAWFMGRPSSGVMDNKIGSWGNSEWRTDAVYFQDFAADRDLRDKFVHFLDNHLRCSLHTCSGGSTYSHTFGVQRYSDIGQFSDAGRGEQTNFYFSYVEPPDKWTDLIEPWNTKGRYDHEKARTTLTMVPTWWFHVTADDKESVRRDIDLYHYLLREGVAGRWSYEFHPGVKGDDEFFYCQRTSYDRTKACIVFKHRAPSAITVFPRELLPEHAYVVGFDSTRATTLRTGADLMAKGVAIDKQAPGEVIYLGLPERPRGGRDKTPPKAPGTVYVRRETNLGHSGVGVYWSPGSDENWVSHYEVRRGGKILGKVATGTYTFDHSAGWDPSAAYAVRTVDGDGNASPWTEAKWTFGEPVTAAALGGLFAERGREGWCADTTTDGSAYIPMTFIRPAKTSSADEGGSPNLPGGVEGYWEGAGGAHIGRAWQQASTEAACVRSWIAPGAGTVRITGRIMKEWYRQGKGRPLHVRILRNDAQIWPESGWAEVPLNDLVGLTHDFTTAVAARDAIRFVLDKGSDPENDIVGWMPRIVYQGGRTAPAELSVVRILCGSKTPYADSTGNVWSQDRFYTGGRAVATEATIADALPTGTDQPLYRHGRQGRAFSYSIPVRPGLYTIRLKFAEPKYEFIYERPFNVSVGGREVLRNFDICQDVRGYRKADERVFHCVVPDAAGRIDLRFTGGWDPAQKTDQAMVKAIEILPEIKPAVRIDCGSDKEFVDWNGDAWRADACFSGGRTIRSDTPLTQASPTPYDQALYQTARAGKSISYSITLPPGLYAVHLKFAELWLKEKGKRPMDIEINGLPMRKSWDPGDAAGELDMAADIRQENVTPDKAGRIVIRIKATGANDAIIQGIEIL